MKKKTKDKAPKSKLASEFDRAYRAWLKRRGLPAYENGRMV